MKKTIAALFALASAAVFAGASDVQIMFMTPGPDLYADGTTVLDGEYYALALAPAAGGDPIVLVAKSLAQDGKCKCHNFFLTEEDVASLPEGTLGVYMLDTRDFAADSTGKTLATIEEGAKPELSKNAMAAAKKTIVVSGSFASAIASTAVAPGDYDLEAAGVPQPQVKEITVEGDEVVVKVVGTRPFVGYTLKSGDDVTNFQVIGDPKSGDVSETEPIELRVPKKDGAQFFKVSTIQ